MRLKPGQLCTINGAPYRAKKRGVDCKGCFFKNKLMLCPSLRIKGEDRKLNCELDQIILVKV